MDERQDSGAYEAPALRDLGPVDQVTAGSIDGSTTDS